MAQVKEEYFPRGGTKSTGATVKRPQHNLLDVDTENKAKTKRIRKEINLQERRDEFISSLEPHLISTDVLSYKKLQDGMVVLGCIRKIKSLSLEIELPGRTFGIVLIKHISTQFSRVLEGVFKTEVQTNLSDLNNLFKKGQFLPTRVLKIEEEEKRKIYLSIQPSDINAQLKHSQITPGMLVWGSVVEKSDHGYVIDLGIENCRALLPFKDTNENIEYQIGQPLYLVVTKGDNLKHATTVTVSALTSKIDNNVEHSDLSIDKMLPGTQIKFTIKKVLKDGLEGVFLKNYTGFINELYLKNPLQSLKKYEEDQELLARVLYVQPATKFVSLTLRGLHAPETNSLEIGEKYMGTVKTKIKSGIVVKFDNGEIGLVSFRRILKSLNRKVQDVKSTLLKKYVVGSKHCCITLDYNQIENMYLCSFYNDAMKDSTITKSQLKLGDLLKAEITEITNEGLVVKIGSIQGFINNIHLANSSYNKSIKKKFKIGQKLNAKVWNLNSDNDINLTIKPDFVNYDDHIFSINDVVVKKQFKGMVVKGTENGVLIVFFGNLRGWLPKEEIPQLSGDDASNIFYEGQIISCYTLGSNNEQLMLSLNAPQDKSIEIGSFVNQATVERVSADGLHLLLPENKTGFLPVEHLGTGDLGQTLLDLYQPGDMLEKLICIAMNKHIILSKTDCTYKMLKLKSVKENMHLKCYYIGHNSNGIEVSPRIKGFSNTILVNYSKPSDVEEFLDMKFRPYQEIMAKVQFIDKHTENVTLTIRSSEIFKDIWHCTYYVEKYLTSFDFVEKQCLLRGDPIGQLKIGQHVSCVVNKFDPQRGCSVTIGQIGCSGIVELAYCCPDLKPGKTVPGCVLDINYNLKFALISLKPIHISKINEIQDISTVDDNLLETSCYAYVLMVNKQFALAALLSKGTNKQLVYLPVHDTNRKLHEAHFEKLLHRRVKVILCKKSNSRLFGIEKSFRKRVNYGEKLLTKKQPVKRKHIKSDTHCAPKYRKISENAHIIQCTDTEIKEESDESDELVESDECVKGDENVESDESVESDECVEGDESVEGDERVEGDECVESEECVESDECIESDVESDERDESDDREESVEKDESIESAESEENESNKEHMNSNVEENNKMKKNKLTDHVADTKIKKIIAQQPMLPGVQDFFQTEPANDPANCNSGDEAQKDSKDERKKKLSQAEKTQLAKSEEERLRNIELELAQTTLPQSAAHFDRVLLGNHGDSEMWLRYIAFHANLTEFDKAREVAKRSLEKIPATMVQERLNIWIAYLNLENMYGTKKSFDQVFEEASRCNDSLTIYLETIKMLCDSQKFNEMDEKIKKVRSKFKQDLKMWLEVAKIYYKCKRLADARKLKDIALLSVQDKQTHMNLLVQFAIMEFNLGDVTHGEALFETILQTDPKRVDVWCTYVDQLIKEEKIDLARNILQRAVGQRLPYKKMRILFKKFYTFEKTYGDAGSEDRLLNLLNEYEKV